MNEERVRFPEPTSHTADSRGLFLSQLEYLRDTVLHKVSSLDPTERRRRYVPSGWTPLPGHVHLDEVRERMSAVAAETRTLLTTTSMDAVATRGGRFGDGDDLPTLASICHHVVAEYARHAGHLDVAVELAGGHRGE